MTLRDFLTRTHRAYSDHGWRGLQYSTEDFFQGALVRAGMFANYGIDFMDEDWDMLVILDACRMDLMAEVADEYDFIETVDSRVSCASHSREWIHKTFMRDSKSLSEWLATILALAKDPDNNELYAERFETKPFPELAYVTWNHFSRILDEEKFGLLDEVWKYGWDDDLGVVEPRYMTERAIDVSRNQDHNRMIVHYMQPHSPFKRQLEGRKSRTESSDKANANDVFEEQENAMGNNMSPFTQVQRGITSYENLWEMYTENLRWVLDDVAILLENVDAEKVVITADHGNAIGEWGCYGHRPYVPIKGVKEVPWVVTSATDERTHEPEIEQETADLESETVRKRLQDLGYV